jgi:hypothetical protein
LLTARRVAPKPAEYPNATEYSDKKVSGIPLPPAWRKPAPTLNRNAGFIANLRLICVGLLPTNLDGDAVTAIGIEITNTKNANALNVHLGPIMESNARIIGENTSPPIPEPERMRPIAEPR